MANLAQEFDAVGVKRLSSVDIDPARSHQHEFACPPVIAEAYGRPSEKQHEPADYLYFADDTETIVVSSQVSVYDARANQPHRSAEFRLYYPSSDVIEHASVGDLLIVAKRANSSRLFILIAKDGSSAGAQLLHLFDLQPPHGSGFDMSDESALRSDSLDFTRKLILEEIGIQADAGADEWLDQMADRFGHELPTTAVFSEYARSTVGELDIAGDPDGALIAWMDRELDLFTAFDAHLLDSKLEVIFERYAAGDKDASELEALFLSRQNQRKSRAGHSLENHLTELFTRLSIPFARQHVTENNSKPDFLFPGGAEYNDLSFPEDALTMLGVKRTLKDRWRQVLTEADRIPAKHLLTLQSPISQNQTDEMQSHGLQLVVPTEFHSVFSDSQRSWLMTLEDFVQHVRDRSQ